MRILYPCNPLESQEPDQPFTDEFVAVQQLGIPISLFAYDDLSFGDFKPRPRIESGEAVLYRGWMFNLTTYQNFTALIGKRGGIPVTSAADYAHCHHLNQWYSACADLTPETVFLGTGSNYLEQISNLNWDAYFIKDFVKSNTDAQGSVANTPEQAVNIIHLIEQYRGELEGGVAVRRVEHFQPQSEQRYFVVNGTAYSPTSGIPAIIETVIQRIDAPFYSVDVAQTLEGQERIVELGDGQVSERKMWPLDRFVKMLAHMG
ncbi:ATP-grasp domain-containing protein [Acaryochloris sp. 'Moss Beach']|uniref:ATP-grasp domain-containing protein n=1 Tax=Acaryochloris sp. 'Moss Beach' TaxID=2740837 RepID=UPI001F1BB27D|nr:ATP-grasp domain-containing protein [Acaryochloris sp. 'Moss Beach']UJB68193.1 ATP-grasp domain-containing protein [Acaryochloris sp. 'Moss Beach']